MHFPQFHIPFVLVVFWRHLANWLPSIRPLIIKNELIKKAEEYYMKRASRKLLVLYIFFAAVTFGAFFPPLATWLIEIIWHINKSFTILGSTEWVTVISLLVTSYFASLHFEKKTALAAGIPIDKIDEIVDKIHNDPPKPATPTPAKESTKIVMD
jgi:hypothetical protein